MIMYKNERLLSPLETLNARNEGTINDEIA